MGTRRIPSLVAGGVAAVMLGLGAVSVAQANPSEPVTDLGRASGPTNDAGPGETPVTYRIDNGTESELSHNSPYAIGIQRSLGLEQFSLKRVTAMSYAGETVVSDNINIRSTGGIQAIIHHNCALFLAEREEAKLPSVVTPDGTVWVGIVNDQLVTLSFYNPESNVALWMGFVSPDRQPMSVKDLTAVAARLSTDPDVVEEVGGACR